MNTVTSSNVVKKQRKKSYNRQKPLVIYPVVHNNWRINVNISIAFHVKLESAVEETIR